MKPNYIIISGTSKAATTSLFKYVADHPEVCPSYVKQTNYFLDISDQERLDLKSIERYDEDAKTYLNFYKCNGSEKYRLEASPDYMNYTSAINKIKKFLESNEGDVVMILREPVSRFKSWFNYGKQQNLLDDSVDFPSYYKKAKEYKGDDNLALLAYETGFYSNYIKEFYRSFDKKRVHIFFYEELISDPKSFMIKFSEKLKLNNEFYQDYDFKQYNKTIKVRFKTISWFYASLRSFYMQHLFKGKAGVRFGNFLKNTLSPLYQKFNTKDVVDNRFDLETVNQLSQDYKEELGHLRELLEIKKLPW